MNFLSKLHNNYILTGLVDSYCLVCEHLLRGTEEPFLHVDKLVHQKNFHATPLLEKHKDDKIAKVKLGYYCVYCNILLKTVPKVALHVTENSHTLNKNLCLMRFTNGIIIAFEDVEIQKNAWHGLIENTCLICNTDFESIQDHQNDKDHIFELIRNKCLVGENYVYRMVDEEAFFCVICARVCGGEQKESHHESDEHKNNYKRGQECAKISLSNISMKKDNTAIIQKSSPKKHDAGINKNYNKENENKPCRGTEINNGKSPVEAKKENSKVDTTNEVKTQNLCKGQSCAVSQDDQIVSAKDINKALKIYLAVSEHTNEIKEMKSNVSNNVTTQKTKINNNKVDDFFELLKTAFDETLRDAKGIDRDVLAAYKIQIENNFIAKHEDQAWCQLCLSHIKDGDVQGHISRNANHNTKLENHKRYVYRKFNENCEQSLQNPAEEKDPVFELKLEASNPAKNAQIDTKKAAESRQKIEYEPKQTKNSLRDNENAFLRKVSEDKKNDLMIHFDENTAYCKRCDVELEFSYNAVNDHIKCHEVSKSFMEQDLLSQTAQYAYENYMTILEDSASCTLCKLQFDLDIEAMKEHVKFYMHRDRVLEKTGSGPLTKTKVAEFLSSFSRIECPMVNGLVLNSTYLLSLKSYHTISEVKRQLLCVTCKMELKQRSGDVFLDHIATKEHNDLLASSNVVSSMPNEFFREIRPGVYHCGFCNSSFTSWHSAVAHAQTAAHVAAKRHSLWTLERCRPALRNAKFVHINEMQSATLA